jgi:hypothetical protein
MIRQVHFEQMQVRINVLYQAQVLDQQMHRAHPSAVHGSGPFGHLVMDVTGPEHGPRLILPVLGLQPTLDSLLAIAKNCGCCVLRRTCFSPHKDGHFELFVQIEREYCA